MSGSGARLVVADDLLDVVDANLAVELEAAVAHHHSQARLAVGQVDLLAGAVKKINPSN
jgi:hypothetical protein